MNESITHRMQPRPPENVENDDPFHRGKVDHLSVDLEPNLLVQIAPRLARHHLLETHLHVDAFVVQSGEIKHQFGVFHRGSRSESQIACLLLNRSGFSSRALWKLRQRSASIPR